MENNEEKTLKFKDRVSEYPNRRKLNIISQTANTIIADISFADQVTEENKGTPLNAETMNEFNATITRSENNASNALKVANDAKDVANNALTKINENIGTAVTLNGETQITWEANTKLDKTVAEQQYFSKTKPQSPNYSNENFLMDNGEDLNNFVLEGCYISDNSQNLISHLPGEATSIGKLLVYKTALTSDDITQEWIDGTNVRRWIRNSNVINETRVWNNWEEFAKKKDIPMFSLDGTTLNIITV